MAKPYFTPEQELEVLDIAKKHPGLNLKQISSQWVEEYSPGRKPAVASTIHRVMVKHKYKPVPRPIKEPKPSKETRYQTHHRPQSAQGYPSDLTDAQWDLVADLLHRPGTRGPIPEDSRGKLNAILYMARTGCQWRYIPREFGKWNTIAQTFYRWRDAGVLEKVHEALRQKARQEQGRESEPSMLIMDSQSVKTTEKGGAKRF